MIDIDDVKRAFATFESGSDRRYFFEKISSPGWIRPMMDEGVFDFPPAPIEEGEYVQYPDWPEAQYLLRMAQKTEAPDVQETILEVLLRIPETENQRVDRTLTEIALHLPPDLAKEWAKVEEKHLENNFEVPPLKATQLGNLAAHTAHGGSVKFALCFLRRLLAVLPARSDRDDQIFGRPQPQIRMEEWRYEDILSEHLPELVKLGGIHVLTILLCPLLEDAIRFDLSDPENGGDFSWIWKPKIEGDERVHDPHEVLTVALRDAVEQLAEQDTGSVPDIIQTLEDQDPLRPVFQRIALHLMRLHPDEARDEVAQHVLDRELLEMRETWHEYALLLKTVFPSLDEGERSTLLENIFPGPSIDPEVAEDLSEKRLRQRIDVWKLRRLSLISEHLSGDAADKYRALVEEYGEYDNPEGPEFSTTATWVGPTSPKSEEELSSLSPEEAVEYLRAWKPSGQRMAPTPEGLGRTFESVVSQSPDAFSELAGRFRELDPTYVRSFISGLEKSSGDFDWASVLELCQWIVNQPRVSRARKLPPSTYGDDVDPDWGWTRKRIATLLRKGMQGDAIPFALRDRVWSILEELAEDSEPTPEYEAKYGGDNMDPLTLSINTVRGEAMHAVVQYALWVRRHELDDEAKPTPGGFDRMPGVRDVLNRHLDTEFDSSLAVRSVYGQWLPQLYLVDSTWTLNNGERIFPSKEHEEEYRVAAWGGYVFRNNAFDDIFEAFREEYESAIDRLPEGAEAGPRDTKRDLAEHLMAIYWRGEDDLQVDGVINKFFAEADDNLRSFAIQRVGQYAKNSGIEEDKAPGIRQRLRDLWDCRLKAAKEAGGSNAFDEELAAFGWWLVSGEFDEEYALQKMVETLQIAGNAKPEIEVIETLAELSKKHPAEALECLRLIVHGEGGRWRIYGHKENETRRILQNALESADEQVQDKAKALTNYLGAQGFFQFRDLLS